MARIPLIGGAYTARSPIASAQRSVNLYIEKNPEGVDSPVTHYLTPGLRFLGQGSGNGWRCLYTATNGVLYGIIENNVVVINSAWSATLLGTITTTTGPASMIDNGTTVTVVDNTPTGYQIILSSNAFSTITDVDFLGGIRVDFIDGFFILPQPNSRNFYSSGFYATTYNPLDFAAKAGFGDKLQTLIVASREIWLLGTLRSEVWYNAGTAGFPFASAPGVYIDLGCVAPRSVASYNKFVFWLAQDKDGKSQVVTGAEYQVQRISNHALEYAIGNYSVIDDAIGMTYQQEGHIFYVLTFPTADKTWSYDMRTGQWHERCWIDESGVEHRHRANCVTFAYGTTVVGDWQNGNLYSWDLNYYADDYDGADSAWPIVRRRGFPTFTPEGRRADYSRFQAEMQCGTIEEDTDPQVYLRWSDDYGQSWGNAVGQSLGETGKYLTTPTWNRLGQARFRVFELFWAENMKTALNGAFVFPPKQSAT